MASSKMHILLMSFPAYGHIIPILELAKKIAAHHDVTFALSASKIGDLKKREIIRASDPVEMFGIEDGVMDDFDNPVDPEAMARVFQAVLPAVAKLLTEMPVNKDKEHVATGEKTVNIFFIF